MAPAGWQRICSCILLFYSRPNKAANAMPSCLPISQYPSGVLQKSMAISDSSVLPLTPEAGLVPLPAQRQQHLLACTLFERCLETHIHSKHTPQLYCMLYRHALAAKVNSMCLVVLVCRAHGDSLSLKAYTTAVLYAIQALTCGQSQLYVLGGVGM